MYHKRTILISHTITCLRIKQTPPPQPLHSNEAVLRPVVVLVHAARANQESDRFALPGIINYVTYTFCDGGYHVIGLRTGYQASGSPHVFLIHSDDQALPDAIGNDHYIAMRSALVNRGRRVRALGALAARSARPLGAGLAWRSQEELPLEMYRHCV